MKRVMFLISLVSLLFANEVKVMFDVPYVYDERMQKKKITIPQNPLIGVIEGFTIDRAKYKSYDKLKLYYELPDQTRMREQYEGKFWNVGYKRIETIKAKGAVKEEARFALLDAYRQSLLEQGASIYNVRNSKTQFVLNKGNLWGLFSAFPNTCTLKVVETEAFEQKLYIDPDKIQAELIKKGKVELEGIYFDTAKATLKPSSRPSILSAAALLKKYPTLVLEIQGHTDSVGSDEANLILSNNRADSVRGALVEEGIDGKRLSAKGYGEKVPVASNETEAGKAQNRRVMLKRMRGGEEKALISIDFFKPIPGFKKDAVREYKNGRLAFRINQDGEKKNVIVTGKEVRAYYKTIDAKDRSFSDLEILKNYEEVLNSFGAEIKGKNFAATQAIYFYFANRGDGQEIYGKVSATDGGTYTIHFFIPNTIKENEL